MKKIDLVEKLKNVPAGTELYSTVEGKCFLKAIADDYPNPILAVYEHPGLCDTVHAYTTDGRYDMFRRGECNLFSSPKKLSWDLFHYAKAKEYVTVISLDENGDKNRHICQVASDGVFDAVESPKILGSGLVSCKIVKIRAATEEEIKILNPKPRFKKGDIIVSNYPESGRIGIINEMDESGTCPISFAYYGHVKLLTDNKYRLATPEEAGKFEKELREKHNHMINAYGDIVRWRADMDFDYYFVNSKGKVRIERDNRMIDDNEQYTSGNYFATRELTEASPLYAAYIH